MADEVDLGPWGESLRQLEAEAHGRREAEAAEIQNRVQFESAIAAYARGHLPPGEYDETERAAMVATLEIIAREWLEGCTTGGGAEILGGKRQFTLSEFRAEKAGLLERVSCLRGESEMLAEGFDYTNGRARAAELARTEYARVQDDARGMSLFDLLDLIAEAEADLEYRRVAGGRRIHTPEPRVARSGPGRAGHPRAQGRASDDLPTQAAILFSPELPPAHAGRPGRPEGDGAFRSEQDAKTKIGDVVKELLTDGKSATQEAVVARLIKSGRVHDDFTPRALRYWVKQKLSYLDWKTFRDAHQ